MSREDDLALLAWYEELLVEEAEYWSEEGAQRLEQEALADAARAEEQARAAWEEQQANDREHAGSDGPEGEQGDDPR